MTVTPREVLFCFVIAAALLSVGFWISSGIQHSVNRKLLRYRQASQIENNNDMFKLSMETDAGDAFVEGEFSAVDSVENENLPGKWLYIDADHQRYTKHTRIVTYTVTDGKGRSHTRTRTETYWSWDTIRHESTNSQEVAFCGMTFPYGKFRQMSGFDYKTVGTGINLRVRFTMLPTNFHASCFTTLSNGTVSDGTCMFKDTTVQEIYKRMTTSHAVPVFWFLWGILTVAVLVVFVMHENDWLED